MNLFRIASLVVLSSKLDDLIKKYPNFESDIKELNSNIPQKYLEWSTKQLVGGAKLVDLIPTVKSFDKSPSKFKFQDINRYKTSKELEDELKELSEKGALESKTQKLKSVGINDAKKLYEDEQYVLIRPDTKAAVQKYGKGTKWCITMGNEQYYEQYTSKNTVFYFLINKQDQSKKYAVSIKRDQDNISKIIGYESYDAEDNQIKESDIPLWNKIEPIIESDIGSAPVPPGVLARNPKTPPEVLSKLSKSDDIDIRFYIAKNPSTPPDILSELLNDRDDVKNAVILNPNTPTEILVRLHNDKNIYVRRAVSDNVATPTEVLIKLSDDNEAYVRRGVANNHNTPTDVLIKLSDDKDADVRRIISDNNKTPPEALAKLSTDKSVYIIRGVAQNINTPSDILSKLSDDEHASVRILIADNINTPYDVLLKLCDDVDTDVKNVAFENIRNKRNK